MANFVALTPPVGQGTWGPFPVLVPVGFDITITPGDASYGGFRYPTLNAPIRVLILKKYPGTILPHADLVNVIPCLQPDPIHIQELWTKCDDVLQDPHIYDDLPTVNIRTFIEREVAEWVAEYDVSQGSAVFVIADSTVMEISKSESKKRAHAAAFQDDTATEKKEPRATKLIKKESPTIGVAYKNTSMRKFYDKFQADVIADRDSPAYLMALNYLQAYASSKELYAARVREIIAKQGEEPITQRCARFFAWGLKQALRSPKTESTTELVELTEPAVPAVLSTSEKAISETTSVSTSDSEDEDLENSDYEELDLESDDEGNDEIINFQPLNKKPVFKFEKSALTERLGSFVEELMDANEKLVAEGGPNPSLEMDDSDGDEHIEMNLGLGVLEEVHEEAEEVIIQKV